MNDKQIMLAEAMQGQLTASSVPGQGSAFTVSLPRAPDLVHIPAPGLAPASPTARPHAPAGANELLANGAAESVAKPFDIHQFMAIIDRYLP